MVYKFEIKRLKKRISNLIALSLLLVLFGLGGSYYFYTAAKVNMKVAQEIAQFALDQAIMFDEEIAACTNKRKTF